VRLEHQIVTFSERQAHYSIPMFEGDYIVGWNFLGTTSTGPRSLMFGLTIERQDPAPLGPSSEPGAQVILVTLVRHGEEVPAGLTFLITAFVRMDKSGMRNGVVGYSLYAFGAVRR
jgi:hypothetical protein